MRMPSAGRKNTGYTIIELMLTLVIIGILLALTLPAFSEFFEKNRLRGAADDAVTFLAEARTESVKRDRDVRITLGGSTTAWCLGANGAVDPPVGNPVAAAAACNCTNAAQCFIGGNRYAFDSTRFTDVTVDAVGDDFTFDSKLGTLTDIAATPQFTLTSKSTNWALRVDVSPLGHARACVPNGKRALSGYKSC